MTRPRPCKTISRENRSVSLLIYSSNGSFHHQVGQLLAEVSVLLSSGTWRPSGVHPSCRCWTVAWRTRRCSPTRTASCRRCERITEYLSRLTGKHWIVDISAARVVVPSMFIGSSIFFLLWQQNPTLSEPDIILLINPDPIYLGHIHFSLNIDASDWLDHPWAVVLRVSEKLLGWMLCH